MVSYRSESSLNIYRYYKQTVHIQQCSGSVAFWYGSGSFSLVSDIQDTNKKFFFQFLCLFHFEGIFTSFLIKKVIKKSQNSINQAFSYFIARWWKVRISIRTSRRTDPDSPKIYRSGTLLYSIVGMAIQSWTDWPAALGLVDTFQK